jgi:uncharacterized membrane protein
MKYSVEIIIDKPLNEVIALFDNLDNMKQWMEGLQSFEPISGTPGQPGAKSKLVFLNGGRKMEMIETITVNNLPKEFSGTYEANGVFNIVQNFFEAVNDRQTRYATEQEFQFHGFMKIIGWIFPAAFKKQSMKFLKDFKRFAESV